MGRRVNIGSRWDSKSKDKRWRGRVFTIEALYVNRRGALTVVVKSDKAHVAATLPYEYFLRSYTPHVEVARMATDPTCDCGESGIHAVGAWGCVSFPFAVSG